MAEWLCSLREQHKKRALLAASAGGGGNDSQDVHGIVQGHAYAVLRVKDVSGMRFVRFRNPWGKFEWKGRWSDVSELWKQHPKVAKVLKQDSNADGDDGAFWMEWSDVLTHFPNFDICLRSRGALLLLSSSLR